jgi:hypothetical protein
MAVGVVEDKALVRGGGVRRVGLGWLLAGWQRGRGRTRRGHRGNRQRQQDRMHTTSQSVRSSSLSQVSHHLGPGVAARHSGLDAAPTCETP